MQSDEYVSNSIVISTNYPQSISSQIQLLSANDHFFIIYPSKFTLNDKQFKWCKQERFNPYLFIYKDDEDTKWSKICEQFIKELNINQQPDNFYFTLQCGYTVNNQVSTVGQLKRKIRRQNIDGLELFFLIDRSDYVNQLSTDDMLNAQAVYNLLNIDVPFEIPQHQYIIYLPIEGKTSMIGSLKKIKDKLCDKIWETFKVKIKPQFITLTLIKNNNKIMITDKEVKSLSKMDKVIINIPNQIKLPKPEYKDLNQFIVIKGEGVKYNKFSYQFLKNFTVEKILRDIIGFQNSFRKATNYGLRILDVYIKPIQSLAEVERLKIVFGKDNTPRIVEAAIVPECLLFYGCQNEIRTIGNFDLQVIIDKEQTNRQHREQVKKKGVYRSKNTTNSYFQNYEHVEPILLYTSSVKVKVSNNNIFLYQAENQFLRNQNFGYTSSKDYAKWQYLFANQIITQLQMAPTAKSNLYRGFSYIPKYQIGQIVQFKQITSTSASQEKALDFAVSAMFDIKLAPQTRSREIKELSFYDEEEVIFPPYTYFRVISISKNVKNHRKNKNIDVIYLQELPMKTVKQGRSLFILWVDNNDSELMKIKNAIIQSGQSIYFVYLKSTKALFNWIYSNQNILNDPTVETLLITNMARVEQNGLKNEYAGIQTILQYMQALSNGKIIVFVGYLEGALAKLKQYQLNTMQNFIATNQTTVLQSTLEKWFQIKTRQ